jgi:hypothetical protein
VPLDRQKQGRQRNDQTPVLSLQERSSDLTRPDDEVPQAIKLLKLLAWDGSGMVLVTKWLHQGRFTWPPIRDGVVHLSATQLTMLLDGLEWTRVSARPVKQPAVVG